MPKSTLQDTIKSAVATKSDAETDAAELACVQFLCFGDARVLRRRLREAIGDTAVTATIIDDLVTSLRFRLDAKRVFKAVYAVLRNNVDVVTAATQHAVEVSDLRYVLGFLTPTLQAEFLATTKAEWCAMPDIKTEDFVQPLNRHCDRIVYKARFVSKYDPAVSIEDLKQDLMLRGLRSATDYEHMRREDGLTDYVHILNMARSSVSSGIKDIIDHHTHDSRQRIRAIYTCQACSFVSSTKVDACADCGAVMHATSDRGFAATTVSMNSASGVWKRKHQITKNPEGVSNGTKNPEGMDYELFQSLTSALDSAANRYLLVLMREDPGFDAWLAEQGRSDVENLSDNQLRNYGADYIGEPRAVLDRKLHNALNALL